ncbi:hypothetical protein EPA93_40130 [Ktedonosporobacter rubrisoli]|uniref:Uncharacterized protein n=1 Tax=Ktedonosporobacter rubrisoli TaxID=2509675 RepID=A0A4P6K1H7_KTERU|nr:hypothetical protein [Ktedonosporobacter rubrisoli]QBD81855.1 hypothetical protein EPA93_40130 [Ktedonosporobacter rubrisoli]
MASDTRLMEQIAPYQPWLILAAVFVLFVMLRVTRKALRQRVDEIGYHLLGEKGLRIWFWLNAPGVILHELSHAFIVLLFSPFGFRITSITLFRIRPVLQGPNGRVMRSGGRQSLQLGEVQYVRPQGRVMSYIGDGISGIAPLFGGTVAFILLYWVATGYNLWDIPIDAQQHLQLLRPGWPWWTLVFAPYLILTVTSELWPSRQDWYGARWFVSVLIVLIFALGILLWYLKYGTQMLNLGTLIASHVNFALLVLIALDVVFLLIAEILVRALRR